MKTNVLANFAAIIIATSLSSNAYASPGHDHGDASAAPNTNGPMRNPDGTVFLPKPAQRQINVRTTPAVVETLPRSVELSGKIVMNPNAGGRVQSTQGGRIVAGPAGLPHAGKAVRRGDVLAYVVPTVSSIETANQAAQIAQLRADEKLAQKRLARQNALVDTVPRKEIEATENDLQSLKARISAISTGQVAREALVAPVAGVIASANVVAGQVIDARELAFEIIDPTRLHVEALAYDAVTASDIASANMAVGTQRVPLRLVGAARTLREQALPITFEINVAATQLKLSAEFALGQPVQVFVQSASMVKGVSVPSASLMKNTANQTVVWVKTAPERFEARVVTVAPLSGVAVAITAGLQAADRVVTQGATLINQIR